MKNKEKLSKIELCKTIIECIRLLHNYKKSYVLVSLLANIMMGVLPAASLLIMQKIINGLQAGITEFANIVILIVLYIITDFITTTVSTIYSHYHSKVSMKFNEKIEINMLDKALSMKLSDFEDNELHNIISRARGEGTVKIMGFFTNILTIVKQIITIISSTAIVSFYAPLMIVFILIVPIAKYVYAYKINIVRYKIARGRTSRERKAWYITHLVYTGIAFKEICVFGLKRYFEKKYEELKDKTIEEDIAVSKRIIKAYTLLNLLDNTVSGIIFANIVYGGFQGVILIGDVVTFTRCIFNVKNSVENIFSMVDAIGRDALFVSQFFEFMNHDTQKSGHRKIGEIRSIVVKNLSYRYSDTSNYVLRNINFELKTGVLALVVGLNGSGKSTLMKVLLGFYSNYEGQILINGIELKEIEKSEYFNKIGCIFQDYIRYEATVRENIAYGSIDHMEDDALLMQLIQSTGLMETRRIDINTMLGTWFENAQQLSGGEWQKIALARAFLKRADFYVLDEPDSALDLLTESVILEQYFDMMQGKIGVYSSHRFSNMNLNANIIIVLDKGRMIEQGTHDELMAKQGLYYKLYCKSSRPEMMAIDKK